MPELAALYTASVSCFSGRWCEVGCVDCCGVEWFECEAGCLHSGFEECCGGAVLVRVVGDAECHGGALSVGVEVVVSQVVQAPRPSIASMVSAIWLASASAPAGVRTSLSRPDANIATAGSSPPSGLSRSAGLAFAVSEFSMLAL